MIFSRSNLAGTLISKSLSPAQRTDTPILVKTSITRLTSSIRGIFLSRDVPLLSMLAQRIATAAFLLFLSVISPLSSWLPSIRRFTPWLPRVTIGRCRASLMRPNVSKLKFCLPCSIRLTADWLVPNFLAKAAWVRPLSWRIW